MPSRPVLIGRGLAIQTLNHHNKPHSKHVLYCAHTRTTLASTIQPTTHGTPVSGEVHRVTAAIATGKHPVPSRTRKLSLPAPMVLQPRGCGRVGRRRTNIVVEAIARWPLRHLRPADRVGRAQRRNEETSWPRIEDSVPLEGDRADPGPGRVRASPASPGVVATPEDPGSGATGGVRPGWSVPLAVGRQALLRRAAAPQLGAGRLRRPGDPTRGDRRGARPRRAGPAEGPPGEARGPDRAAPRRGRPVDRDRPGDRLPARSRGPLARHPARGGAGGRRRDGLRRRALRRGAGRAAGRQADERRHGLPSDDGRLPPRARQPGAGDQARQEPFGGQLRARGQGRDDHRRGRCPA